MKKEIDMKTYMKRNQYNWFHTFIDPTYGFNVEIDVTELVLLSKERKESFFPYFLYMVMKGVNSVDELKMREIDGRVYLFDEINPTFTVMTDYGIYQNAGMKMNWDFPQFYKGIKEVIEKVKHIMPSDDVDLFPICKESDVVYLTCVPIISYVSMTHPTPGYNYSSLSVPRICFDKYKLKDNRYTVTLNITVSHTLVDGFPLAKCFQNIQEYCSSAREILLKQ